MKKCITLRLATAAQEIPSCTLTMTYRQFSSMENGSLHTKTVRHSEVRASKEHANVESSSDHVDGARRLRRRSQRWRGRSIRLVTRASPLHHRYGHEITSPALHREPFGFNIDSQSANGWRPLIANVRW